MMKRRARGLGAPSRVAVALLLVALAFAAAMIGGYGDNPVFAQTTVDYDDDDDGLIDVRTLAQLDAIRHDLDGNGDVATGAPLTAYNLAFPNRVTTANARMGCPTGTCTGYELRANLDFDTDGDGSTYSGSGASATGDSGDTYSGGAGWNPIGGIFTATFKGNGHVISNLFIRRIQATDQRIALFRETSGTARIESVGLANAYVRGWTYVGILVGRNKGTVAASWSSGYVHADQHVGGLVAQNRNDGGGDVGAIIACYSTATVYAHGTFVTSVFMGGLVGELGTSANAKIVASYSSGPLTSQRALTAGNNVRGLHGAVNNSGTITDSYWDSTASNYADDADTNSPEGVTTANLQAPTGYTGIYENWNVNVDGTAGNDDPWHFGTSSEYPVLKFGGMDTYFQRGDYDRDNDGLIEIRDLAQLNVVRHDLDGNGAPTAGAGATAYGAAFPHRDSTAAKRMGCPSGTCAGYELDADLDFDTDGDGATYTGSGTSAASDSGDAYHNSGNGFAPIGSFASTFKGNGHTISNLFIQRTTAPNNLGLFSLITSAARVESVGLENAYVYGNGYVGALVGRNEGVIAASYVSGYVRGGSAGIIGGLVGYTYGLGADVGHVTASYSTAAVSAPSSGQWVGGLVGFVAAESIVTASYSTGTVTATGSNVGAFYGFLATGGAQPASVVASYWDSTTSARADDGDSNAPEGVGTAGLQTVLGYEGIYAGWNVDVDGATGGDDPWDFGLGGQYPALKYGGMDPAKQRAELVDYDTDGDRLIEITTLAQLDAVRRDLDGNGSVAAGADTTAYNAAFANRDKAIEGNLGCVSGSCAGYELAADLDFDTDGDGATYTGSGASAASDSGDAYHNGGAGWNPISTFNTTFKGNGYIISNLFIKRTSTNSVGLFGTTSGGARIESVGLKDAFVHARSWTGALVGTNYGTVIASWSSGAVRGRLSVGGLVGLSDNTAANRTGVIAASYSRASVYANLPSGNANAGGLVGAINKSAPAAALVTASYSTGAPSAASSSAIAGLTNIIGSAQVAASYWDTTSSGRSSGGGGSGQNTAALQTPTGYTGIYANWNIDLGGTAAPDDPWDFGGAGAYPTLKYGGMDPADQRFGDYDLDGDALIEIANLAQFDAVRHDLNGDGDVAAGAALTAYSAAFPERDTASATRMGCPSGTCEGYELTTDLDFDTDGDGATYTGSGASATGDADDAYYNADAGFEPIGDDSGNRFDAVFKGNGFIIYNLFIKRATTNDIGLFGSTDGDARVESVGLKDAYVSGGRWTGALVGANYGTVAASWSSGEVRGEDNVGGLVGTSANTSANETGEIIASYSHASAHSTRATGLANAGGLVGSINKTSAAAALLIASYSTGTVTADSSSSNSNVAALTNVIGSATVTASYWDSTASGISAGGGGSAQTTTALQAPTGYTGIFAAWDVDVDGVTGNDDPWDFGGAGAYPRLKYGGHDPDDQFFGDYDMDGDGLIEMTTLAQLDAIRHDLDGDGDPAAGAGATAYDAAFPERITTTAALMGCPSGTCAGYELLAALDFDTDGDGSTYTGSGASAVSDPGDAYHNGGLGWEPIGTQTAQFRATFKGNGNAISNLFIKRTSAQGLSSFESQDVGLFGNISNRARVESAGVENAYVHGRRRVGGLIGSNAGLVAASYSTGYVRGGSGGITGGLVGYLVASGANLGHLTASYSTAAVSADASGTFVGGLVGYMSAGSRVTAGYSTGTVTTGATSGVGGFVGAGAFTGGDPATIEASYWDSTTSGRADDADNDAPEGVSTAGLQTVFDYTGIYENWNVDVDGIEGADDPWDFGLPGEYPLLKYGGMDPAKQHLTDFDRDGDGLIEISTLAQLDAMRHDRDGNGDVSAGVATTAYNAAFRGRNATASGRMGCTNGACSGYELIADLDFDTNGNGYTYTGSGSTAAGDPDDAYYDSGLGFAPIGADSGGNRFETTFRGNGHIIHNLFIKRDGTPNVNDVGLFGAIDGSARVESVGLKNAYVYANQYVGALVGTSHGTIAASWSSGAVRGKESHIGGLVGWVYNGSAVIACYSSASVHSERAAGMNAIASGLAGIVGAASGSSATITASYSTGRVTSSGSFLSGLAYLDTTGSATVSYWDLTTSGIADDADTTSPEGVNTAGLQNPTGYTGIFANWNVNVDGVAGNDDPWYFGSTTSYPTLKFGGMDPHAQYGDGDYDVDNDGLIEISTLDRLNAVRWDLDGDAAQGETSAADWKSYLAAFPNAIASLGCPDTDADADSDPGPCTGYELAVDLDFDADNRPYRDWTPIGSAAAPFSSEFDGNNNKIANLKITAPGADASIGLFANSSGTIKGTGLPDAKVTVTGGDANTHVGALLGEQSGSALGNWSTGAITQTGGTGGDVGGLIGYSSAGRIGASWSGATVKTDASNARAGGLGGRIGGEALVAVYTTGAVTASGPNSYAGGVLGEMEPLTEDGFISAYVTGPITKTGTCGGATPLYGVATGIAASAVQGLYWNTETTGYPAHPGFQQRGHDIATLRTPTDYTSPIYANWQVDVDGDDDTADDAPLWNFGTTADYPKLTWDGMDDADQTIAPTPLTATTAPPCAW